MKKTIGLVFALWGFPILVAESGGTASASDWRRAFDQAPEGSLPVASLDTWMSYL